MARTSSLLALLMLLAAGAPAGGQSIEAANKAYDDLPIRQPPDVLAGPKNAKSAAFPESIQATTFDAAIVQPAPWTPVDPASISCATPVDPASQAEYLRRGGWFGSLELTMLRASFNNAPAFSLPADMPLAPRYIVGLESAGGLGARARFWRFDNEYQALSQFPVLGPGGVFPSFGVALTADRFDMDFYRHLYFSRGELIFGASVAAASVDVSATAPYWLSYVVTQSYSVQQSGGGAGVFLEGRHQFSSSSIS